MTRFAIIGFGEVGSIFARDLHAGGAAAIAACDIDAAANARAAATGYVSVHETAPEAAANADVVFVAVTAGSTLDAVAALSGGLGHAPFVVDVNSVSPTTKQRAARIVEEAGGRYVEAAVMTSVPPKGLRSPMLLGGPHARDLTALMASWDMRLTVFSEEIGRASSVKMCRSVLIKGLEALVTESMLAARRYGVEREVLRTLGDTLPHADWPGLARYVMSRALLHGKRRAEEMREVARTVQEAGIEPRLARAIAERQDEAWAWGQAIGPEGLAAPDLDTLLAALAAATAGRSPAVAGAEPAPADAATLSSEARVPTAVPRRYLAQLCKHFAHKLPVGQGEDRGRIEFPAGPCELDATAEGTLVLRVTAGDESALGKLEDVVARHLERFAFREKPEIRWSRTA